MEESKKRVVEGDQSDGNGSKGSRFVTFDSSDIVKSVLANGSPHYVYGASVLVKPYREKPRNLRLSWPEQAAPVDCIMTWKSVHKLQICLRLLKDLEPGWKVVVPTCELQGEVRRMHGHPSSHMAFFHSIFAF